MKLDDGTIVKVGVGITTYNRFGRFKECFEHLIANSRDIDEILIVEDCSDVDVKRYDDYFKQPFLKNIKIMRHRTNKGVGISKNDIMEYFYNKDFDYFFTLEDDINVIHADVFKTYIQAAIASGYHYLNFAEHGEHNNSFYISKVQNTNLKFYPNIVGAFTLYTRYLIDCIGYHDPRFINAMEHVEYTYRASQKGLTSRFWHFADVVNNTELLEEQDYALVDSSIRVRSDWSKNVLDACKLFKEIHGVNIGDIPR